MSTLPLRSGHGATNLFLNRRAVDWRDKQPSRTAYADWLRDSAPAVEEVRSEPGAQEPPGADYEEAAE
jgi:hypothetical protein